HVAGLQVLVRSLLAGTEPVVLDLAGGFDPVAFADGSRMISAGVSGGAVGAGAGRRYTALVPTQLRRLLSAGDDVVAALASYDAVLLGGAAAPPDLLAAARAVGVRVVTTYGMSETCGGCVYDGVPLDGVRVRLGEDGRVELGGTMVFAGYRGRPDLTSAARRVDADGVAWHLTQDLGVLSDDGRLDVLGRVDDVIVTGGEKVAPALVERALASYAGIRELAVVGVPDPEWGQRVVAVVVPADAAAAPSLEKLRAHGAHRLPPYALPRSLVIADAIPLLGSGKPDRVALRALAAPAAVQVG
ncbi:MAG TPA: AMP-binding protein, partial [Actinomycetes bacterium]|nr:AMP-binding protein [Actinomycetes bacterium]